MNKGDTIYFGGEFVKIDSVYLGNWYHINPPVLGMKIWFISKPVTVKPDTPENRLAVQLKHS